MVDGMPLDEDMTTNFINVIAIFEFWIPAGATVAGSA